MDIERARKAWDEAGRGDEMDMADWAINWADSLLLTIERLQDAAGEVIGTLGVMERPGVYEHGQECIDALNRLRLAADKRGSE